MRPKPPAGSSLIAKSSKSPQVSRTTPADGAWRKPPWVRAGDAIGPVFRQSMGLVLVGLVIGLAVALALSRRLSSYLYEVSPTSPLTYVTIALLLAGVDLIFLKDLLGHSS